MRRFFSFILAASLLLAPSAALAQNNSALASTDKVMIDRVNANGEGTPGAISVLNLFNGTGVGYGVGGGGAVTQITSRATAVTLNSFSGQITMFSAAGSATAASFTVNDSLVKTTDVIEVMPVVRNERLSGASHRGHERHVHGDVFHHGRHSDGRACDQLRGSPRFRVVSQLFAARRI
jgi:hypothetical protein